MIELLESARNILLIILGFGFIIAVHELGHFLAAKWAGVRVHAFAIGFGSAICSWRKGLGFRWGSSEREHQKWITAGTVTGLPGGSSTPISPTEYRLNWFPFGGYVKMLGQEDLSPMLDSAAPDSFVSKPVWKRMIIISGGVFMNLVLAAILFVIAFTVGVREVAPIVGDVSPASPAKAAGLMQGDRVIAIDGVPARSFTDMRLAIVMARKNSPVEFTIERQGESSPRIVTVTPHKGDEGLQQIGAGPPISASVYSKETIDELPDPADFTLMLEQAGLAGVQPGMTLVSVNGTPTAAAENLSIQALADAPARTPTFDPLRIAIEQSNGAPVSASFRAIDGSTIDLRLTPRPTFQIGAINVAGTPALTRHLAGLVPAMRVQSVNDKGRAAGLRAGDVFARLGAVEWPSIPLGIAQVRAHAGSSIPITVLREGALVSFEAKVGRDGLIGFRAGDTADESTLLASSVGLAPPPAQGTPDDAPRAATRSDADPSFPATSLVPAIPAGSRILKVEGTGVTNFAEVRAAILASLVQRSDISITIEVPASRDAAPASETVILAFSEAHADALRSLGWDTSAVAQCFDLATFTDCASDPWHAVVKGVRKTHQLIVMTYVTFLRLYEGSVPVTQMQGPVGITHIGSQVAAQGFIELIFFLGLISANLAVINFLPLPIVDGGLMVFLLIEGITRRPVSPIIQNIATMAGIFLIGSVFLFVTFNDIMRWIG